MPQASELVAVLFPEVFQTEESAHVHPAREAKRLEGAPPAAGMLAVSVHAKASLERLRSLAEARGHAAAEKGTAIGKLFSTLRDVGTDVFLSSEKSFRGTILGMQHGVGVFLLLQHAAEASGDDELAMFCVEWLGERRPLIEQVERDLGWFARHPDVATSRAHSKNALRKALAQ